MTIHVNAVVKCLPVGDYVDEAEIPTGLVVHPGEVVRPSRVTNYLDDWESTDVLREFTVFLKDGRILAVRGHTLKHSPHPVADQDVYSIVLRTRGEEVLVGLFKTADVAGIFHGEIRANQKVALSG